MATRRFSVAVLTMVVPALFVATGAAAVSTDATAGVPAALRIAYLQALYEKDPDYTIEREGNVHTASGGGLRARFDRGVTVSAPAFGGLGLELHGIGRAGRLRPIPPAAASVQGNRLEYRREAVTEWYINSAKGLEQGFTLSEKPGGDGALVLEIGVDATPGVFVDGDAGGIRFAAPRGGVVRYANLAAWDVGGRTLPARLEHGPGTVRIVIDDQGAAYPVTIDPLIYVERKVVALDGAADDSLGAAVAISGDTAIVGARYDAVGTATQQGSAYIFVRQGGLWVQQAKLTAGDGAASDWFGFSVAISGDTALVGACRKTIGTNAVQGAAYVFVRSAGVWAQQARLTAADGQSGDGFGDSVALEGDTAIVGADGANGYQGAVYLFTRSGSDWTASPQPKLVADDGLSGDSFGWSAAISGDTLIVGAPYDRTDTTRDHGSAYVFVLSGGLWGQQAKLTAGDAQSYDYFGDSVDIDGGTAIVGADGAGAAYVFTRSESGWAANQQQKLVASDALSGEGFGWSVAISGDTIAAGAAYHTIGANVSQGAIYLFTRGISGWEQRHKLTATDGGAGDRFGMAVALAGGTVLTGADGDAIGANVSQGSAYFFDPAMSPDVSVDAFANATTAQAGDTVVLWATAANYGPGDAEGLAVSALVPAGLNLVAFASTHGTYDDLSGIWDIGALGDGLVATLAIQATVSESAAGRILTFSPSTARDDVSPANNAASVSLAVPPQELLVNGGMETDSNADKLPNTWARSGWAAADGRTTAVRRSGAASVLLTANGATKLLQQQINRAGVANEKLTLVAYGRPSAVPSTATFQAQLLVYNGSTLVANKALNFPKGTVGWAPRSLTTTVTQPSTRILVRLSFKGTSGKVWLDDISLKRTAP